MSAPALLLQGNGAVELLCPRSMPKASTFLWNRQLFVQVNCRGYASALHMQPEPGKYAYGPLLEARSFLQPEQPHFAHHPGRFVYIKDEDSGEVFSLPYEPTRVRADHFCFRAEATSVEWQVEHLQLRLSWKLCLPPEDAVELWELSVESLSPQPRRLSVYPYFPVGYMSWMNQSAHYDATLGAVIARCITGYQKLEDYPQIRSLKDHTFLLHETPPDAWECRQQAFEGEGGLAAPDALQKARLAGGSAHYETPAACLQYRVELSQGEERCLRFVFGPARDAEEILRYRQRYLRPQGFAQASQAYRQWLAAGIDAIALNTPAPGLDAFVQPWLCRQVFYLAHANRFSTDPQTRNYLQDAMGAAYLKPEWTREAFARALSQQEASGAMPDGILLNDQASLKYINQIPHTDHCIWLPVCLQAYLDETADFGFLDTLIEDAQGSRRSVFDRITASMQWLLGNLDARGLSLMGQGDWCDPMNMVGHRGRGVSGWLSIASTHALRLWAPIADARGQAELAVSLRAAADALAAAVQAQLWEGRWFARGITDDGRVFGTRADSEGQLFLNPQSWALMAGIATADQQQSIHAEIAERLASPAGLCMLDPPYTRMHEDIGRVTQKYPGAAENGSVYNHASAFYLHALYQRGESERAYALLLQLLPGADRAQLLRSGQLPTFIPNYYRGAHRLHPESSGRSSQLVNTGSAAWVLRSIIEGLFGTRGCAEGLMIAPQLPASWASARLQRRFRGATFELHYQRQGKRLHIRVEGRALAKPLIEDIRAGVHYRVDVQVPE